MKSRAIAAAVLVLSMVVAGLAAPTSANALVLGFYGNAGLGSSDWDNSGSLFSDDNHDTRHAGLGFVMGTASMRNPVNYRMYLGYEEITHEGNGGESDITMNGLVVDQDLLFNLTRGQVRLWVGPELRLGFLSGSSDAGGVGDQNFFVIGAGPVMGLDFRIAPSMGLSWKLGYLISSYSGDDNSWNHGHGDTSLVEGHGYISLALLFSTWGGGYHEAPMQQVPVQQAPPAYYPRPR